MNPMTCAEYVDLVRCGSKSLMINIWCSAWLVTAREGLQRHHDMCPAKMKTELQNYHQTVDSPEITDGQDRLRNVKNCTWCG